MTNNFFNFQKINESLHFELSDHEYSISIALTHNQQISINKLNFYRYNRNSLLKHLNYYTRSISWKCTSFSSCVSNGDPEHIVDWSLTNIYLFGDYSYSIEANKRDFYQY